LSVQGVTAVTACDDGNKIISGGGDGLIRVWKIGAQSQVLIESLKEHKAFVTSIKVKRNGQACVSSSADGTCIVWDLVRFVRSQIIFAASLFAQVRLHVNDSFLLSFTFGNQWAEVCAFGV
jgi:cilia- and flagella-associated protein 52